VKPLEDLHIPPPRRGRPARHGQVADNPVDILGSDLPCRAPQHRQRPLQQSDVIVDGDLAEAPSPPRRDERIHTFPLEHKRIRHHQLDRRSPARNQSQPAHTGTPSSRLNNSGSTQHSPVTPERSAGHADGRKAQLTAGIREKKHMRAPHGWTKTFTDPRLCAAIVDRITFGGNIIETGTDSFRLAQTRAKDHPNTVDNARA
jgi:hypothetical protein